MKLILILILLINVHNISSQDEFISCRYDFFDTFCDYSCYLNINNPNGFNNFTDISGAHLAGMSDEDVETVEHQYSAHSITTNIPSIICQKFPNLKHLLLYGIGIVRIDDYSFRDCKNILVLWVGWNEITSIAENALAENTKLLYFMLFGEPIKTLPEGLFQKQHELISLVMYFNNFEDLPENIFLTLRNLEELWLFDNGIKYLKAEWFSSLENLQALQLDSNPIEDIPENTFSHLRNLRDLEMSRSALTVIHSNSFGKHPNLTRIGFSENQIFAIDEKLFDNVNPNISASFLRNVCTNARATGIDAIKTVFRHCFNNYEKLSGKNFYLELFEH